MGNLFLNKKNLGVSTFFLQENALYYENRPIFLDTMSIIKIANFTDKRTTGYELPFVLILVKRLSSISYWKGWNSLLRILVNFQD